MQFSRACTQNKRLMFQPLDRHVPCYIFSDNQAMKVSNR